MHTLQGHDIERNKIKKLITKDNKDDMTSIIIDIYDQYKKKDIKYDMLDKFIIYAKEKRYKESTVTKSNGTYLNLSKLVEISQSITISQENPQDKFSKTNVK